MILQYDPVITIFYVKFDACIKHSHYHYSHKDTIVIIVFTKIPQVQPVKDRYVVTEGET